MAAATLAEMASLMNDPTLIGRVQGAVLKTAYAIKNEAPETANHVARLAWAKSAAADPVSMAPKVWHYCLGSLTTFGNSLAQLTGVDDTTLQSHVDASVDILM